MSNTIRYLVILKKQKKVINAQLNVVKSKEINELILEDSEKNKDAKDLVSAIFILRQKITQWVAEVLLETIKKHYRNYRASCSIS